MKRFTIVGAAIAAAWLLIAGPALAAPLAGPPYPNAVTGQRIYDYAGIFSSETIASAQQMIDDVQARTGAEIAVYTQVKPESDTLEAANADALALMNQWGVGRKGFDDGLVIMFDMQANLRHGEVSLYAGSGYKAAFLSDQDRQRVFDDDMKPLLAGGDLNGGLLVGLRDVQANATPEHAATLERGRQINAVVALGGLFLGLLLVSVAVLRWLRHGRDPVYIDDNSILMPAPPAGLTPAMATLLLADRTSDRTVTAELVDLAARGTIAFKQENQPIVADQAVDAGIAYLGEGGGVIDEPEKELVTSISTHSKNHDGYISSTRLYHLIPAFGGFRDGLEKAAVSRGWLADEPGRAVRRWAAIGGLEVTAAIVVGFIWLFALASGLLVLTVGLAVAGAATLALARFMPARTRQGAMMYAMLSAYERTLGLTMTQSSSMGEVLQKHALPWVKTPDQAMVWAIAFGLDRELEVVLARSMSETDEQGIAPATYWHPTWWMTSGLSGGLSGGGLAHGTAGLFSSSAIPNPGSIVAALGSIVSPSSPDTSSGSSSGSSFSSGGFGGGGGGGGGGAGGGF